MSAEYVPVDRVTYGKQERRPGAIVFVPEITIERGPRGLRPSMQTIAGVHLRGVEGTSDPDRSLSVMYHYGRMQWCCMCEYVAQNAPTHDFGTLAASLRRLAGAAGVAPPRIVVREYGVGIYDAAAGPDGAGNPWKVEHGDVIEVANSQQGLRHFQVVNTMRGQELAKVCNGIAEAETFGFYILSAEDWESFKLIGGPSFDATHCEAADESPSLGRQHE